MKLKLMQPGSFLYKLALWLLIFFMRAWTRTLRLTVVDPQGITEDKRNDLIAIFWHNRIFAAPARMPKKMRSRCYALTSRSKDGQVIADALANLGIGAIRGSSNKNGKSKGGSAALRQMIQTIKDGNFVALIPDGPRGPKYSVQPGVLATASRTGAAVLPMSLNAKNYFTLKTWDRLQIPFPFSKAELVYGELLEFPTEIPEEEWETEINKVHTGLMAITKDSKDDWKK